MIQEAFGCHVGEDAELLRQIAERLADAILLPNDVDVRELDGAFIRILGGRWLCAVLVS